MLWCHLKRIRDAFFMQGFHQMTSEKTSTVKRGDLWSGPLGRDTDRMRS